MSAELSRRGSGAPPQDPQPAETHNVPNSAQEGTSPKVSTVRLMLYIVVVVLIFASITYAATSPPPH